MSVNTISIIPINNENVNIASVFSLGVKDRALQGCNLSVTSSPPGESTLAFFMSSHTLPFLDQIFDHVIKEISDQLPGLEDNSWGVISEKPINQLCAAPLNFGSLPNLEGNCLE
jgi:hypothetical protein